LLIGRGELEADVKKLVASKNLTDSVIFLGVRNDVPDLLNAMDVFLLPSRFEGLPVTLVEVQANGLSAFVSDTITNEIKIGHHLNYISLSESPESWAKKLLSQASKTRHIGNCILDTKYDIQTENINLALKYRSLLNCEIS
jgi:glycosyltransferase involved in cell wall biosynthesis